MKYGVGIYISKGKSTIAILSVTGEVIEEPFEIKHDIERLDLLEKIKRYFKRRFKNAGSIIAYAGLDAPPYQSGQFEATNRHISKRGNKYLRKTGYEVMKSIKSSCKSDNELKSYIIQKENEGKLKK